VGLGNVCEEWFPVPGFRFLVGVGLGNVCVGWFPVPGCWFLVAGSWFAT
jgi:hypothetical protein